MKSERQRIYWVWCDMRYRCSKKNHKAYKNYGGRGISVCKEWESFFKFLSDMGKRPEGFSIDRIDNNGNYNKTNCRWVDRKTQNRNKRNCIMVDCKGKTVPLKVACSLVGLKYRAVHKRIRNRDWDVSRALSTPIRKTNKKEVTNENI